jgi:predicted ATPase
MSSSIFPPESSASFPADDAVMEPLPRGPMDLRVFLKTAIRITSALVQLHTNNTIHRNIRPQNILVHAPSNQVKLTGHAGAYATHDPRREASEAAAALPYMSPEQTEDMKRPVDHRSDLYSLGVTFYEMLSGKLPFQAEDPIGWVQCHLTVAPPPLIEVAPDAPLAVSDIIMKLLNKTVEERYQSARGLLLDLETCLVELRAKGSIEPFPLGARDVWHGLRISAKLYGREDEIAALFASFERVVASGTPEIGLVSGYSGIGKTSVVLALHKPIVRERGFFLSGKFDQHKRNIPYVTISQAFRDIIRQILTERTSQIELWKNRLTEALGPNGQLLIEIIPQLEELIGPQPPVAWLPTSEAQNRFNAVFRTFLGVFAKREHPLVLFLDDLQYADFASLRLLNFVLTQGAVKHLFVLGAYRDNEVSPSHPAITTLEEIRKAGITFTSVVLKPLEVGHLKQLVADTFHFEPSAAEPLARLLHKKTGGNPFFANQFLAELHHENLVRFDVDNSTWQWNIAEIEAKEFTDDVVELMASKLKRLPGETQAALQLAACIGSEFEVELLQQTHDKTPEETYQDLDEAVRAEFMLRRGNIYKFMHDRVHQAAYSLIPQEQVMWVHLRIGRLLLERTPEAELDDKVFVIVNQFNLGARYISEEDEQRKIAGLNLMAGKKAKASAAYQSAASHFTAAIQLLAGESWATDYKLAYELHIELAECEYLNGKFDECERICRLVIDRATSDADRGGPYPVLVQLHATKGTPVQGLEMGVEFLQRVGIEISLSPEASDVLAEIRRIHVLFKARRIEDLINLSPMNDATKITAMIVLATMASPAYMTNQALFDLLMCRLVSISIENGNTGASAMGYATFGLSLCTKLDENEDGYRFGQVAWELIEKYNLVAFKTQIANVYGGCISPWTRHVDMLLEYSRIGLQVAHETGNVLYGCFHHAQIMAGLLVKGAALEDLYAATTPAADYMSNSKFFVFLGMPIGYQRFVRNLQGKTADLSTFSGDDTGNDFNEPLYEAQLATTSLPLTQYIYYSLKLQARYLLGFHEAAVVAEAALQPIAWSATGVVITARSATFSALNAAALYADADAEKRKALRARMVEHETRLSIWAKSCPDNFLASYKLVCAESARIDGKLDQAAALYDEAIAAAHQKGFTHDEALGNELAASFYISRGDTTSAGAYMKKARSCYDRWRADGKVKQLDERYPDLSRVPAA